MSEEYKEALLALHDALAELKALGRECEGKIQEINIILEKQGLPEWPAGEAVGKAFCKEAHESFECGIIDKIDGVEKRVNSRLKWAWGVIIFVLGTYGTFIGFLLNG